MRPISHRTVKVRQNFQEKFEFWKRVWPINEIISFKVKNSEIQISGPTKKFRNLVKIWNWKIGWTGAKLKWVDSIEPKRKRMGKVFVKFDIKRYYISWHCLLGAQFFDQNLSIFLFVLKFLYAFGKWWVLAVHELNEVVIPTFNSMVGSGSPGYLMLMTNPAVNVEYEVLKSFVCRRESTNVIVLKIIEYWVGCLRACLLKRSKSSRNITYW